VIQKKGNIINSFGTAIIVVFFLFLFSSFSDTSFRKTNSSSQYALTSGLNSDNTRAVIADAVQLPSFQKSCISLPDNLACENHIIVSGNWKITQSIIFLRNTQVSAKPVNICGFYYHFFSKDDEDLPVLS
jgi:hypothetical protein